MVLGSCAADSREWNLASLGYNKLIENRLGTNLGLIIFVAMFEHWPQSVLRASIKLSVGAIYNLRPSFLLSTTRVLTPILHVVGG